MAGSTSNDLPNNAQFTVKTTNTSHIITVVPRRLLVMRQQMLAVYKVANVLRDEVLSSLLPIYPLGQQGNRQWILANKDRRFRTRENCNYISAAIILFCAHEFQILKFRREVGLIDGRDTVHIEVAVCIRLPRQYC